jgi:undecaprenyl pyrophosphate synthase
MRSRRLVIVMHNPPSARAVMARWWVITTITDGSRRWEQRWVMNKTLYRHWEQTDSTSSVLQIAIR